MSSWPSERCLIISGRRRAGVKRGIHSFLDCSWQSSCKKSELARSNAWMGELANPSAAKLDSSLNPTKNVGAVKYVASSRLD